MPASAFLIISENCPKIKKEELEHMKQLKHLTALACALALVLTLVPAAGAEERPQYTMGQIVGGDPNCEHHIMNLYQYQETVQATCTENGYGFWPCEFCGAKQVCAILYPQGHRYSNGVCRYCGEADPNAQRGETASGGGTTPSVQPGNTPAEPAAPQDGCETGQHKWSLTITPSSCSTEGKAVRTCDVCGKEEIQNTIPTTGHTWRQLSGYRVCTVCGETEQQLSAQPQTQPEEPGEPERPSVSSKGSIMTGSTSLSQLSKQEIIGLLEDNPLTMPSQVFDVQPSCSAPYAAGKLSSAALQAALDRLNALRRISGIPAASLSSQWSETAQYGAVVLGALGTLSHTPSQPAGMDKSFFDKGYSATYSSNLSAGRTLVAAVDGLMDDYTAGNITSAGHRRWQLSPALKKVGFGYVNNGNGYRSFVDEKVFDRNEGFSSAHSMDYDSFGWPAAGYFPNDMAFFSGHTPWTVELNPDVYAKPSGITVKISGGGKNWTLSGSYPAADSGKYLHVEAGDPWNYGGSHCIIFRPDGVTKYEGVYTVEIDGLKHKDGSAAPFAYTVEFFSTAASSQPSTPEKPSTPSTPKPSTPEKPSTPSTPKPSTPENPSTPSTPKPSTPENPSTPSTPKPSGSSGSKSNPFADVPNGSYYYDAVLWALEEGVTGGFSPTEFRPNATCTRGQAVTFLWRAKGCPEPKTKTNPFQDVPSTSPFYKAILWAQENGIAGGVTATAFNPGGTCTSGHVVTFLWRASGKPAASGSSSLASANPGKYYTDAVAWADAAGLLDGVGEDFAPANRSPRADIVTYLYRSLAG